MIERPSAPPTSTIEERHHESQARSSYSINLDPGYCYSYVGGFYNDKFSAHYLW